MTPLALSLNRARSRSLSRACSLSLARALSLDSRYLETSTQEQELLKKAERLENKVVARLRHELDALRRASQQREQVYVYMCVCTYV